MAAERSVAMAPMPTVTASRRARVVMPLTAMPFAAIAPCTYPSPAATLVSIGGGVGSGWTNAIAVNTKATKAFGHGTPRLLEDST